MFSCPNCGGNVKFDISSQQLACESCSAKFDPYYFEDKTKDAEETTTFQDDFEVTIFTCPQCGGEILSTDNAAAGFCSFCGASTILYSRISHEKRPNYIIPFQKTKEDCKKAYAKRMKRAIFAPKELKNPKYIDSFRGIYMPYWAFYITQEGPLSLYGNKSYRSGDYICTDHYLLSCNIDAYYKGLSYDASSSFSDSISETLAPYDVKGMKAFTPAYLSGFYADIADVDASVYQTDAEVTAYEESFRQIVNEPVYSGFDITVGDVSKTYTPGSLNTHTQQVDSTMFPVWFMSYRKNGRVAYATVNGQTGKVAVDTPVAPLKYTIGSIIIALPIFWLLVTFVTMLPDTLLMLSAIIAVITSFLYTYELSAIIKKDTGQDDLGKLSKNNSEKVQVINKRKTNTRVRNKRTEKESAQNWNFLIRVCFLLIPVAIFAFPMITDLLSLTQANKNHLSPGLAAVWLILLIAMVLSIGIGFRTMNLLPVKQHISAFVLFGIAITASSGIALLHPVSDLFYYFGTIVCLISVILCIKDLIHYFNILSTHRLPQFDKQGGDDRA